MQTNVQCFNFQVPSPSRYVRIAKLGHWTSDLRIARVAQLTERWSYKPEAEGLNPSLGTKPFSISHFPILIFHCSAFASLIFQTLSSYASFIPEPA